MFPAAITTAVAAAALTLSCIGVASAAPTAPARKVPVVYQGMGHWSGPSVRPHHLLLGADTDVSRLTWSSWKQGVARGHGRYLACAGAQGPCVHYWGHLRLTHVKVHNGKRYFATLRLSSKGHRTRWLVMRSGSWRFV
jgi:hypothetical protein